jgi:hypothetical protein
MQGVGLPRAAAVGDHSFETSRQTTHSLDIHPKSRRVGWIDALKHAQQPGPRDTPFPVNPAGFVIHSAVHSARHDAQCVLHTHSLNGVAASAQREGLLPISQQSMFVLSSLAYHDYEGGQIHPRLPFLRRDPIPNAWNRKLAAASHESSPPARLRRSSPRPVHPPAVRTTTHALARPATTPIAAGRPRSVRAHQGSGMSPSRMAARNNCVAVSAPSFCLMADW